MEQILTKPEQHINQERRLYDDVTTWLAETLDGSMRTPFTYTFDGRELYAQDGGSMKVVFEDALEAAKALPSQLGFEYRRRLHEYDEYQEMIAMMKGELPNTMIVVSDFPPELMESSNDIGGYNTSRKQTMLRIVTKNENGTLSMRSQSLDGSDRRALENIYRQLGLEPQPGELLGQRMHIELDAYNQEFIIDALTGVYDRTLAESYGGEWRAGRQLKKYVNTYDFVRAQSDLITLYIKESEKFGDNPAFLQDITAAMHKRYENFLAGTTDSINYITESVHINPSYLLEEILAAGKEATEKGVTFSGCGLTLGGSTGETANDLTELGFGNKSQEDKYGSLTFKCPKGHTNRRPRNKLIPNCTTCGTSVRC